jgi:hypothetical protein
MLIHCVAPVLLSHIKHPTTKLAGQNWTAATLFHPLQFVHTFRKLRREANKRHPAAVGILCLVKYWRLSSPRMRRSCLPTGRFRLLSQRLYAIRPITRRICPLSTSTTHSTLLYHLQHQQVYRLPHAGADMKRSALTQQLPTKRSKPSARRKRNNLNKSQTLNATNAKRYLCTIRRRLSDSRPNTKLVEMRK